MNFQRLDIFGNNLKSVVEVDIGEEKAYSSLSSASDTEVNDQEKELNKSLIPNLFQRKTTELKTRISDKRKKLKKKLNNADKSIDSNNISTAKMHRSISETPIADPPILMDLKLNISNNSLDKNYRDELENELEVQKPKKEKFKLFSKSFNIMPRKKVERKNTGTIPELSNDSNEKAASINEPENVEVIMI